MNATDDQHRKELDAAIDALKQAECEFSAAESEETDARKRATNARNRLNAAQKRVDAAVAEIKKGAPWNTEWSTRRGVPVAE